MYLFRGIRIYISMPLIVGKQDYIDLFKNMGILLEFKDWLAQFKGTEVKQFFI